MPISVLNHVRGDKISSEIENSEGFKPNETYKVVFTPDSEIRQNRPIKKVYKKETLDLLAEAKEMAKHDKKTGKTREESFKEIFDVLEIK